MHRHIACALLLLAGLAASAAPPYDFSAARAVLTANADKYPGGVFVLIEQEGQEIFRHEGGLVETSTRGLASATKWLSAAVVLRLADRGLIDLDAQIGAYLPQFAAAGKGAPTIRHCFSMTSGLFENTQTPEPEHDRSLTLDASIARILESTPLVFPPGTQLAYDGDGMQIVGKICEVVTGRTWAQLAQDELFTPLGMTGCDYLMFSPNPAIGGGARATPAAYLRFLRMLAANGLAANGTPYLSSRMLREFETNNTLGLPEHYSAWPPFVYPYLQRPDYAFGAWILAQPPGGAVEEVSSPGAFGTWPWLDRKRRLVGILFTASSEGFSRGFATNMQFLAAIRAEIDRVGLPPLPPPSAPVARIDSGMLRLDWSGPGVLELSNDLVTWEPVPWVRPPYLERWPGERETRFLRVR
jgi:CubicO group peptidase (beta-lactamase class C family)